MHKETNASRSYWVKRSAFSGTEARGVSCLQKISHIQRDAVTVFSRKQWTCTSDAYWKFNLGRVIELLYFIESYIVLSRFPSIPSFLFLFFFLIFIYSCLFEFSTVSLAHELSGKRNSTIFAISRVYRLIALHWACR